MKLFNFNRQSKPVEPTKFYTGGQPNYTLAKDQDFAKPEVNLWMGREYVPFGIDNKYPYALLDFYHGSAFHRAIMEFKTRTIMADGIQISMKADSFDNKLRVEKLHTILSKSFFKRFIQEYLIHERVYVKIQKKNKQISNKVLIVPAESVRTANTHRGYEDGFWLNDWRRGYNNKQFIYRFDKFDTTNQYQLIEYQELTPGFDVYAVPGYTAAADWIWLDSQIAYFQKQNMQNSLNPSAIIKLYEKFANTEQEQAYVENLKASFTTARNAGKVMTFVSKGKDLAPDITIAEPNKLDKSFAAAQENIVKNVARAHLINPALMGIESAGKLGNSNELNESFSLFNKVWLASNQDLVESYLQDLADKLGFADATIKIKRQETFLETQNNIQQDDETNI